MILRRVDKFSFIQGIGAGVALVGVALVVVEAIRRARHDTADEHELLIDGIHPPGSVELAARPQEEVNARMGLESEGSDPVREAERW
jgi:hypothetical protein